MAGPDGLPFILAPITFSWGEVVWEGVSETARGVVGWGKPVRGQDSLLGHQLRPLIVGFWALSTYSHVQTCAFAVSLGRLEDTQWGVHTTVTVIIMTPSHNVLSIYISALYSIA